MKYSLQSQKKAHLCHVVTFDVTNLVHGTVASKGHSEVVSSQKSSSFIHPRCNEFENLNILKIPQSKDLSPLVSQVIDQLRILSILSSQDLD